MVFDHFKRQSYLVVREESMVCARCNVSPAMVCDIVQMSGSEKQHRNTGGLNRQYRQKIHVSRRSLPHFRAEKQGFLRASESIL